MAARTVVLSVPASRSLLRLRGRLGRRLLAPSSACGEGLGWGSCAPSPACGGGLGWGQGQPRCDLERPPPNLPPQAEGGADHAMSLRRDAGTPGSLPRLRGRVGAWLLAPSPACGEGWGGGRGSHDATWSRPPPNLLPRRARSPASGGRGRSRDVIAARRRGSWLPPPLAGEGWGGGRGSDDATWSAPLPTSYPGGHVAPQAEGGADRAMSLRRDAGAPGSLPRLRGRAGVGAGAATMRSGAPPLPASPRKRGEGQIVGGRSPEEQIPGGADPWRSRTPGGADPRPQLSPW